MSLIIHFKAIKSAETAGVKPPDLEPLTTDAIPRRGLARKADETPTKKSQLNSATRACGHTESHLMQSGGSYSAGLFGAGR